MITVAILLWRFVNLAVTSLELMGSQEISAFGVNMKATRLICGVLSSGCPEYMVPSASFISPDEAQRVSVKPSMQLYCTVMELLYKS